MVTDLLYLTDFGITSAETKVLELKNSEDGRRIVVLDQTCFYPRGGGQDWDTGKITNADTVFTVEEVRLDEQGVVNHIGKFEKGEFKPGETVECQVDDVNRQINTRLHSAGHVIDMAVADWRPDWVAVRGAHYPHMSFVEYEVPEGTEFDEAFLPSLQEKVNTLSISDYENQLLFMSKEEMTKYCRHVPPNIPSNKPSRIVLYADNFGIPCGGTHVKNVKEIGEIEITKLKIKKGLAKVSYRVDGIN